MEVLRLIQHTYLLQTISEHLHIIRIEHTRVLLNLIVIGIGLELRRLVRDNRNSLRPTASFWEGQLTTFLEVHHRVRIEVVDHSTICSIGKRERATGMGIVVAPALTTYTTGGKVVHAIFHTLIAKVVVRTKSVDLIRGYFPEVLDKLGHFVNAPPEFVAKSKHPEGGMMTIGAQDILTFLMKELHEYGVLLIEIAPERKFWL